MDSKSLKNALDVLQSAKMHLLGWSDVEQGKIKPVALAVIELRWSKLWRYQAVS